jgi:hexosaminidase
MPQLGSSPVSSLPGSGFYTVAEYKEIVAHAAQRHIIVIPEFDMPGHSHAAVNAMEV